MDYEPITKGLRDEMAHGSAGNADVVVLEKTDFEAFCDNIDAIHRSLEAENKEMFDFCDRLKESAELREDVTLYGVDYIPVPLDKDGVPIHIGDTLEWSDGTTFEVVGIGDGTLYYLDADAEGHISIEWTSTELKRHYRPDTWERIIEDALGSRLGTPDEPSQDEFIALVERCKALCERTREGE